MEAEEEEDDVLQVRFVMITHPFTTTGLVYWHPAIPDCTGQEPPEREEDDEEIEEVEEVEEIEEDDEDEVGEEEEDDDDADDGEESGEDDDVDDKRLEESTGRGA